jgi:hypothetical protein
MKDGFATIKIVLSTPPAYKSVSDPVVTAFSPKMSAAYGATDAIHTTPHTGIDFVVPVGTPLHAPLEGVVTRVTDYGNTGLGKAVFVETTDGKQYVVGHMSEVKVHEGDHVVYGDTLGLSGNTGNSTGPHFHFGMFDDHGRAIEPPSNIDFGSHIVEPTAIVPNVPDIPTHNVHVPDSLTGIPTQHEPSGWLDHVNNFADNFIHKETELIVKPIANALSTGIHELFVSVVHAIPIIATVAGLCCFLLTMAMGNGRPYKWGLMFWALSALGRVVGHGIA